MHHLHGLKVCLVAGTLGQGGAERQLYYIVDALCQAGALPRVLSLVQGEFWEAQMRRLGVPVTFVGHAPSRSRRFLRILNELRQNPPDVLQGQHCYVNAYVGLAARWLRRCGIGALRNNGISEVTASGRVGGWLNLHAPSAIAANSRAAIRYAVHRGLPASRLYFLPNVVDTHRFQPSIPAAGRPPTLLAVGRLVAQKRLDRFLDVLHRLRRDHRLDPQGWIVGSGRSTEDLRPQLEARATRLGLLPQGVLFRGDIADMRPVYGEADVCVLTSDHEGTPNVLLEAMASGLPVVAANVGGVPDIVRHGETGLLHAPDDLEGMAQSLAGLIRDPALRQEMGARARMFIEQHHCRERLPSQLSGLYSLALPPRRAARARRLQSI